MLELCQGRANGARLNTLLVVKIEKLADYKKELQTNHPSFVNTTTMHNKQHNRHDSQDKIVFFS